MEVTAIIAAALLGVLIVFHLALAAGAPWGAAVYNGIWGRVLPQGMRINSLVFGAGIYPLMLFYVLDAGEVLVSGWLAGTSVVMWVLVPFFAISAVTNVKSDSRSQRWLWSPVTVALTICALVLALG